MKEFDFDELDRAVSNALSGSVEPTPLQEPAAAASSPAAARTARVVDETVREREAPEVVVPEREAPVSREVPERAPLVSRPRGGGRFMDVVHPSTDMRQTTPLSEVKLATGVIIPEPEAEPVVPRQEVAMDDIRPLPRSEMDLPATQTEAEEIIEDDWSTVPDSPFLPDAKVEKRPLGASEPTGDAVAVQEDSEPVELPTFEELTMDDADPVGDFDSQQLEEPASEPAAEVSQDVEAVSSEIYPDAEVESVPEFDLDAIESTEASAFEVVSPAEEPEPAYAGPVAITPQYTAKPSSAQQSGEIFDTEAYHQPFAAPIKKKGGAMKVILVSLLILLLGAAVGAVVYIYVLPML